MCWLCILDGRNRPGQEKPRMAIMSAVEITAFIILSLFYASFFIKMLLLKRRGINSNLLGKGRKPAKALSVEKSLKTVTFIGAPVQLASVFLSMKIWSLWARPALQVSGLILAALGTGFFISAMAAMKSNWRSGCETGQNTSLVVAGPYKISRNPAFVGFDLLYLGYALAFPNVVNLIISGWAVATFHRQILEEEAFLETAFGEEYRQYKSRIRRYLGRTGSA